jgi:hypothetical protein
MPPLKFLKKKNGSWLHRKKIRAIIVKLFAEYYKKAFIINSSIINHPLKEIKYLEKQHRKIL